MSALSSDRLLLRGLESGDASIICGYRSLPEVARFQSWETFGLDDAARLIANQDGAVPGRAGTWFQWAIIERATGKMVGDCGLHTLAEDSRQMELGITLSPAHHGFGYAKEALACVLELVFGTLGAHRVRAVTDAENERAAALFERLGFRKEAHLVEHRWFKGRWDSEFIFGLLRREWDSR